MSEIYQAPAADLEDTSSNNQLDNAVNGDYIFSAIDAFAEGRALSNGYKWKIHKAALLMFLAVIPAYILFLVVPAVLFDRSPTLLLITSILGNLAYIFVTTPLSVGFLLMAANRATGGDIESSYLWAYFSHAAKLLGTMILLYIMVFIGFLLLIIPGIYLSIAYIFAMPLIADKGLSPWEALETSRKAVTKKWFSFFGMMLIIMIVNIIAMIPLGLGLIWTVPWTVNTMGVAYRNTFGFNGKTENV